MEKKLLEYMNLVTKTCTIDIISSLRNAPMRYKDFTKVCSNDKTLSSRLKELQDAHLIETVLKKEKNKSFIYYKITEKGNKLLNFIDSMDKKI